MRNIMITVLIATVMFASLGCSQKETQPTTNVVAEKKLPTEPVPILKEEAPQKPLKVEKTPELKGALLVMIDNNPRARPQSGLDKADVVYEIFAEGGITRFMAIFYHNAVEKIGPVRSARYYFAQIAKAYNSPYAHAGGSEDALHLIPKLKIQDMDEIYNSGAYFWRSKDRSMPHNLYTSTNKLLLGADKKGYSVSALPPINHGVILDNEKAEKINLTYNESGPYIYSVKYLWHENRYQRYINDKLHETLEGNSIFVDNIIVLETKTKNVMKDVLVSEIKVLGEGPALFFTQGQVVKGKWVKESEKSHFEYIMNDGKEMFFSQGTTFIQLMPSLAKVEYK